MLHPDFDKWGQTAEDMRQLSLHAAHPRSRERYQALYMIGTGQTNATRWAQQIKRDDQTVMGWIHRYNAEGSDALLYKRSGGHPPFFSAALKEEITSMLQTQTPQAVDLPGYRWTLKKLVAWIQAKCQQSVSKNTVRALLRQSGFSWKKCKKLLAKAKPEQRQQYIEQLSKMFMQMCAGQAVLVYIDEAHFHQDLDLGYSWSRKGVPQWVKSSSPKLSAKMNYYGAYDFTRGQCFLWHNGRFNSDHTIAFFQALADWLDGSDQTIYIILDGAPWHRSKTVAAAAAQLGFTLIPLPAYSPDLNPIEGLWKWMREEITQLHCHPTVQALADACIKFINDINLEPDLLLKRLWPKFDLDPDFEKLLVSN